MTSASAPRWLSRKGARTSTTPRASPATNVNHSPTAMAGSEIAGSALRRVWCVAATGLGTKTLATMSVPPATVAAAKAGPVPTWLATAPMTGPRRAPPTAAAKAVPSAAPRRSALAAAASQASPPAQVHAPATPWTNRAVSSSARECAYPKTRLATLMAASPIITAGRTPRRLASTPPGTAPSSVPMGYDATRMPACALERPRWWT